MEDEPGTGEKSTERSPMVSRALLFAVMVILALSMMGWKVVDIG